MQELYAKYAADNFAIAAFPCNQFAEEEPGTNAEVKEFAQGKYGATFDLYSKIDVNGSKAHPLYEFLKNKKESLVGSPIKWNFAKFLCDKNGVPVKRYAPDDEPNSFEDEICKLLGVPKK